MKRQTRLTPAEGGKFAGPIGTPVPPNAADLGVDLGDSAFEQRAHSRTRTFQQACDEKGIEAVWISAHQMILVQADRVLARVDRMRVEFSTFDQHMDILDEVVRRASTAPDSLIADLDTQAEKLRRCRAEVDMLKRAALGDSEMIEHLRDQNAALVKEVQETRVQRDVLAAWKSHRLACDKRAHD